MPHGAFKACVRHAPRRVITGWSDAGHCHGGGQQGAQVVCDVRMTAQAVVNGLTVSERLQALMYNL